MWVQSLWPSVTSTPPSSLINWHQHRNLTKKMHSWLFYCQTVLWSLLVTKCDQGSWQIRLHHWCPLLWSGPKTLFWSLAVQMLCKLTFHPTCSIPSDKCGLMTHIIIFLSWGRSDHKPQRTRLIRTSGKVIHYVRSVSTSSSSAPSTSTKRK